MWEAYRRALSGEVNGLVIITQSIGQSHTVSVVHGSGSRPLLSLGALDVARDMIMEEMRVESGEKSDR